MLATTIQITNNPPHTTHTQRNPFRLAAQATTTHQGSGRSHGVEREPDSVLICSKKFMPNPKTHPHPPPHPRGSKHMQAQENKPTRQPHKGQHARSLPKNGLPRKEVIQPHLPVRLPCYDFVPIANPTFDHSPRKNG